jgi:hypothetical protein
MRCDPTHSPQREKRSLVFELQFAITFFTLALLSNRTWRRIVARKTILVCDNCGKEVAEGKGAVMRLNFTDARRGAKQADLCDNCAGGMPGKAVARRGRRPKAAAAA